MASDIGFIGIGNMGFGMASNVRKKMPSTSTLHIFDINTASCKRFITEFQDHGRIVVCASPKEIAEKCSTVISMIPKDSHVLQVYLDPETGIIAAPEASERLLLECSTIQVATTQKVGKEIMKGGKGTYIDTPVSGGVSGAAGGTLSFFIGHSPGDEENSALTKRIRQAIGYMGAAERINFCSGLGTGLVCKIANNYAALSNLVVASQAMALGVRHGVDKKTLYKCISSSSGGSWVIENMHPVPGVIEKSSSSDGFRQTFSPGLSIKDITLGIQAAKDVGVDPSMGEEALKTFQLAHEDSRTTDLDVSAIWLHISRTLESADQGSSA